MRPSSTCGVCGTVNVLASSRCIACGQPLQGAGQGPVVDDSPTATTGTGGDPAVHSATGTSGADEADRTAPMGPPMEAPTIAQASAPPAPPPGPSLDAPTIAPPPSPSSVQTLYDDPTIAPPPPPVPAPAPAAAPATPVPPPPPPAAPPVPAARPGKKPVEVPKTPERSVAGRRASMTTDDVSVPQRTVAASPAEAPKPEPGETTFVVRLLLPEGDKRLVEVGATPLKLGSGLDEIGLAGDPRARPGEATLSVVDGKLFLDVHAKATAVYRRIDGEEVLEDGDVVLIGDVAAEFRKLPAGPAVEPDVQVLGGAAASPCGRLAFLRRDGSPGPVHDLPGGKTIVGRTDGHLNFPQDSRLSRRHVRFFATEERVTVEDLDSRNGTYVRVRGRRRVDVGDALRVGSAGVQIRGRG